MKLYCVVLIIIIVFIFGFLVTTDKPVKQNVSEKAIRNLYERFHPDQPEPGTEVERKYYEFIEKKSEEIEKYFNRLLEPVIKKRGDIS